jgi:hypothetical protein
MLTVRNNSGTKRLNVLELLKKKLKLVTLEINKDKDTLIPEIKNNITLARITKVVTPLKFNSKSFKLKEFITKVKIYFNYNDKSFESEDNRVIFVISYFEGFIFDFIFTFVEDYD